MTMTSNSKLHFPTEETTTPISQQDQHRPLLSHMSLDPNNGTNNNAKETSSQMYYGAITENNISMHGGDGETNADQKHSSSPQHTSSYNVVNHGHAYSDAVLGGVVDANIIEGHGADADEHKQNAKRNPKEKVSYWSIVKSNGNFRWYMMSYLVTIAGE